MPKLREEDCGGLDASREAVFVDTDEDEWSTNGAQTGVQRVSVLMPFNKHALVLIWCRSHLLN